METKFSLDPAIKERWTQPGDGLKESDFQRYKEESSQHPRYKNFNEEQLRILFWRQYYRSPSQETP